MKNEERKSKKGKTAKNKAKMTDKYIFRFSLFIFHLFILLFSFVAACELGGPVQMPSYTIIYHPNGGSGKMGNSTLVYGASINLNANEFIREGYGFTGWAETPAGEVKYADRQSVNNLSKKDGEIINLYAQWRGNSYTVVYNANGGTGSMEDSVFTYGVPQNLRDNTYTRTGYTFAGWARTSGGQVEYADGANVTGLTTTGTAVLFAQWQGISYTVAYDANGGQGTMAESNFIYGTAQNLRTNTFTFAGHALVGWARTPNGAAEFANGESVTNLTAIAGDTVTLYAQWALAYEVSFNADGGSPAPVQQMVVIGGKVTEPDAMSKTGYAFDGWYKEASLINKWNFASDTVTTDITLYAKWIPIYTVTFNADGGSPAPVQQTVASGSKVTEPDVMSKTGYTFDGWYKEAEFNNRWNFVSDIVIENITLYAKWNINQYTITFNANGGTPAPTSPITINHGQKITEPAVMSKADYAFDGWYKEAEFNNKWNFASDTVTVDITLYAKWQSVMIDPNAVIPQGNTLAEKLAYIANNSGDGTVYDIVVNDNIYMRPAAVSTLGRNITVYIRSTNHTSASIQLESQGHLFSVGANITLILQNIVLRGISSNNNALVLVGQGGKLILNSGSKITLNTNTPGFNGGGIYVNGGILEMNEGSEIIGNKASGNNNVHGGGINVENYGSAIIHGGNISENRAEGTWPVGGGIYIGDNSTVTMMGGIISKNYSSSDGGGVWVRGNFNKRAASGSSVSGIIYGSVGENANTAGRNYGHAVYYYSSPNRMRNSTLGYYDEISTSSNTGWE